MSKDYFLHASKDDLVVHIARANWHKLHAVLVNRSRGISTLMLWILNGKPLDSNLRPKILAHWGIVKLIKSTHELVLIPDLFVRISIFLVYHMDKASR